MAFWKPGTSGPGVLIERETEREAEVPVFNPDERLTLSQQRVRLPIYQSRKEPISSELTHILSRQSPSLSRREVPGRDPGRPNRLWQDDSCVLLRDLL